MQHPFAGIVNAEPAAAPAPARPASRRSFLGRVAGGLAGVTALAWATPKASAQMTTMALGEEGGRGYPPPPPPGQYTTYALGEEGSSPRPPSPGQYTTYALGEEGSYRPRPPSSGYYTTYALGEEGSYRPPPPSYTTRALGEEGGSGYPW